MKKTHSFIIGLLVVFFYASNAFGQVDIKDMTPDTSGSTISAGGSCTYTGSISGVPLLDAALSEGEINQVIEHPCLPLQLISKTDANQNALLILKDTNSGLEYRLGAGLEGSLTSPSFEGNNKWLNDKTFFGSLDLPLIYALHETPEDPARLVVFAIEKINPENSKFVYLTSADKHTLTYYARTDVNHLLYVLLDGLVFEWDMRTLVIGDKQGIYNRSPKYRQISLTGKIIINMEVYNDSQLLHLVLTEKSESSEDGFAQLFLYSQIGDPTALNSVTETIEQITFSPFNKHKPVVHADGSVLYNVLDGASSSIRVATVQPQNGCEFYLTGEDELSELLPHRIFPVYLNPQTQKGYTNKSFFVDGAYRLCDAENLVTGNRVSLFVSLPSEFDAQISQVQCDVKENIIHENFASLGVTTLLETIDESLMDSCDKIPACAKDQIWDSQLKSCIDEGSKICASGTEFDIQTKSCVSICEEGEVYFTFNFDTKTEAGACVPVSGSQTCPDGQTFDVNAKSCVADEATQTCPEGTQFDVNLKTCAQIQKTCPEGFEFNATLKKCENTNPGSQTQCPEGLVFDVNAKKCLSPKPDCDSGSILNPQTQLCESMPSCANGLKPVDGVCPEPVKTCSKGAILNPQTLKCEMVEVIGGEGEDAVEIIEPETDLGNIDNPDNAEEIILPEDPETPILVDNDDALSCPEGSKPNAKGTACIKLSVCPEGSTFDPKSAECLFEEACPPDTNYNPQTDLCESEQTCPEGYELGAKGECLQTEETPTKPVQEPSQDCLDDKGEVLNLPRCQQQVPVDQVTCPEGTIKGYKGQCRPITNTQNQNAQTKPNQEQQIPMIINAEEASEQECSGLYDAVQGVCYDIIADATADIGESDDLSENPLVGGMTATGSLFSCSLSERAPYSQSFFELTLMIIAFIRIVTNKRMQNKIKLSQNENDNFLCRDLI